MTPEEAVKEILRLRDEAASAEFEMPGAMHLAWNHPGVVSYQIKTQPHYERDMREAKWLGDIEAMRNRSGSDAVAVGDALSFFDRQGYPVGKAIERRGEIASPYWHRGALAYGQPLRNGIDVMQAFGSTSMNAGRMIAGDPGAGDDFADSSDRLMMNLPSTLWGSRPGKMQQAWEQERDAAARVPVGELPFMNEEASSIRVMPRIDSLPYELKARSGLTAGSDFELLRGDSLPAQIGALAVDTVTDPGTGVVDAIRALLGKQVARAAYGMAGEFAVPGAFLGLSNRMAADLERQMKDRQRAGY